MDTRGLFGGFIASLIETIIEQIEQEHFAKRGALRHSEELGRWFKSEYAVIRNVVDDTPVKKHFFGAWVAREILGIERDDGGPKRDGVGTNFLECLPLCKTFFDNDARRFVYDGDTIGLEFTNKCGLPCTRTTREDIPRIRLHRPQYTDKMKEPHTPCAALRLKAPVML